MSNEDLEKELDTLCKVAKENERDKKKNTKNLLTKLS